MAFARLEEAIRNYQHGIPRVRNTTPAASAALVAVLIGQLHAATDGSGVYLLNLPHPTAW
ncbi:hypothetical protein GX408_13075 [bacterium]|nr:hypothetical protein [bacterium]